MIDSLVITRVNRDRNGNVINGKVCLFNEEGEEIMSFTLDASHLKYVNLEKIPTEITLVNIPPKKS